MADLKEVLREINSENLNDWSKATVDAADLGAKAVAPLADRMKLDSRTKGRAARLALQGIVHHAAKPGNDDQRKAVAAELLKVVTSTRPRMVKADCLHWLGLIGGPEQVPGLSKLLDDRIIREDVRIALERIPGDESLKALDTAAKSGPTDFRKNIQQSLHNRALTTENVGIKEGVRTIG